MKIGLKTRFVRYVEKDSFCDTSSKSIWTLMQMWKLIHANYVEKCWKTLTHIEDTWLDHMVLVLRAKFVEEMILEQNKVCLNTRGISMVCTFESKLPVSNGTNEVLIKCMKSKKTFDVCCFVCIYNVEIIDACYWQYYSLPVLNRPKYKIHVQLKIKKTFIISMKFVIMIISLTNLQTFVCYIVLSKYDTNKFVEIDTRDPDI